VNRIVGQQGLPGLIGEVGLIGPEGDIGRPTAVNRKHNEFGDTAIVNYARNEYLSTLPSPSVSVFKYLGVRPKEITAKKAPLHPSTKSL
jgi:hypothetical protein